MIQRKQTLFLLGAILSLVVCLCLPIGAFEPKAMGIAPVWYNLGIVNNGALTVYVVPFILLALAVIVALISIFLYKKRKTQMRLCSVGAVLCLAWVVYYVIAGLSAFQSLGAFKLKFAACLPLIGIVFFIMARRGIKHDDDLIRSADRIR
jgi:small-conductance mechanosensitive channel